MGKLLPCTLSVTFEECTHLARIEGLIAHTRVYTGSMMGEIDPQAFADCVSPSSIGIPAQIEELPAAASRTVRRPPNSVPDSVELLVRDGRASSSEGSRG
jgi:hypothetical protein